MLLLRNYMASSGHCTIKMRMWEHANQVCQRDTAKLFSTCFQTLCSRQSFAELNFWTVFTLIFPSDSIPCSAVSKLISIVTGIVSVF